MNCVCTHAPELHTEYGCNLCPCFTFRPCQADKLEEFDTAQSALLSLHRMPTASPRIQ
jgi:hypothetical protein